MKLYIIKNDDGEIFNDSIAFIDRDLAFSYSATLNNFQGSSYSCVNEIDIDFDKVGKYLYYIRAYFGFNYSFHKSPGIYDVINTSTFYPYKEMAKSDRLWECAVAKAATESVNIHENSICSSDYGEDWNYGDCMEGKFNLKILKVKVNKEHV